MLTFNISFLFPKAEFSLDSAKETFFCNPALEVERECELLASIVGWVFGEGEAVQEFDPPRLV
jgi:hypothetical protein